MISLYESWYFFLHYLHHLAQKGRYDTITKDKIIFNSYASSSLKGIIHSVVK